MSINAASTLRRAMLYVPSSSPKFLQKALTLPFPLDTLTYDLEDSVAPHLKSSARTSLLAHLTQPRPPRSRIREISVRINDVSSGHALEDLTTILKAPASNIDTIVVPKVNSASDLHFITDVLRHTLPSRHPTTSSYTPPIPPSSPSPNSSQQEPEPEPGPQPIKILALIESAQSLLSLPQICTASPYLHGLIFAAEDFALDLSLTRTLSLSEFLYARSLISTSARAYNLASTIDLVCTSYRGPEGLKTLEQECEQGRGLGFNGKQCIHPSQVEVVQRCFAPGEKEVEWSVRVVVGDEKAEERGRGAWTLEGKMIDKPVVGKARAVVKRAEMCGFDVEGLRERWRDQEPE